MALLKIEQIRRSISGHSPIQYPVHEKMKQAAVSIVLRPGKKDTEALFILRATKDGDPWSGHMAFPGGHYEVSDESLRHTSERETWEEIGLDLTETARYVGQIDPVRANPRGRDLDMIVTPFVYELTAPDVSFNLNYEVAEVLWGSLRAMHEGSSHTMGEFVVAGKTVNYPGYAVDDEIVWGLTYRMIDLFFAALDPDWVER
ncbi:MAG: CoA pyrophosphatase [Pseudomonadales bacterium]|jgi:8-oxo-dGTP pyrophosphatase MutT (NUDIX family)|tara:strand:- start:844 stop:1449 length:606 start_codon:yes stop_codon:yes gene_type:complete